MIEETVVLLMERWDFFAGLLTEHLQISFISIFCLEIKSQSKSKGPS